MQLNTGRGFTIVELLIVIVVIAILAAISIVAFNGVQNRANDSSVQADLKSMSSAILQAKTLSTDEKMPLATVGALSPILKPSKGAYKVRLAANVTSLVYCRSDTQFAFIAMSKSNNTYVSVNGNIHKGNSTTWGGASVDLACQTTSTLMTQPELDSTGFSTDSTYGGISLFSTGGWAF